MDYILDWAISQTNRNKNEAHIALYAALNLIVKHKQIILEETPEYVSEGFVFLQLKKPEYVEAYRWYTPDAGFCMLLENTQKVIFQNTDSPYESVNWGQLSRLFANYCQGNPHFSGNRTYPVKAVLGECFEANERTSKEAYETFEAYWRSDKNMWLDDDYGQARWALIEGVHEQVKQALTHLEIELPE